eukprot:1978882-Pleurochrysis_carterae.AAC.1
MYGEFKVFIHECRISNTFVLTYQNRSLFAAAHAINFHHDLHRVGDALPSAALAARARGHRPPGAMHTTRSSLPSLSLKSCSLAASRSRPLHINHRLEGPQIYAGVPG